MTSMFVAFFVIVVCGYVYNTFLRFKQKEGNEFLDNLIQAIGIVSIMISLIFMGTRRWYAFHSNSEFKIIAIVGLIGLFETLAMWLEIIEFKRGIHSKFHKYLVAVLVVLMIIVIIL